MVDVTDNMERTMAMVQAVVAQSKLVAKAAQQTVKTYSNISSEELVDQIDPPSDESGKSRNRRGGLDEKKNLTDEGKEDKEIRNNNGKAGSVDTTTEEEAINAGTRTPSKQNLQMQLDRIQAQLELMAQRMAEQQREQQSKVEKARPTKPLPSELPTLPSAPTEPPASIPSTKPSDLVSELQSQSQTTPAPTTAAPNPSSHGPAQSGVSPVCATCNCSQTKPQPPLVTGAEMQDSSNGVPEFIATAAAGLIAAACKKHSKNGRKKVHSVQITCSSKDVSETAPNKAGSVKKRANKKAEWPKINLSVPRTARERTWDRLSRGIPSKNNYKQQVTANEAKLRKHRYTVACLASKLDSEGPKFYVRPKKDEKICAFGRHMTKPKSGRQAKRSSKKKKKVPPFDPPPSSDSNLVENDFAPGFRLKISRRGGTAVDSTVPSSSASMPTKPEHGHTSTPPQAGMQVTSATSSSNDGPESRSSTSDVQSASASITSNGLHLPGLRLVLGGQLGGQTIHLPDAKLRLEPQSPTPASDENPEPNVPVTNHIHKMEIEPTEELSDIMSLSPMSTPSTTPLKCSAALHAITPSSSFSASSSFDSEDSTQIVDHELSPNFLAQRPASSLILSLSSSLPTDHQNPTLDIPLAPPLPKPVNLPFYPLPAPFNLLRQPNASAQNVSAVPDEPASPSTVLSSLLSATPPIVSAASCSSSQRAPRQSPTGLQTSENPPNPVEAWSAHVSPGPRDLPGNKCGCKNTGSGPNSAEGSEKHSEASEEPMSYTRRARRVLKITESKAAIKSKLVKSKIVALSSVARNTASIRVRRIRELPSTPAGELLEKLALVWINNPDKYVIPKDAAEFKLCARILQELGGVQCLCQKVTRVAPSKFVGGGLTLKVLSGKLSLKFLEGSSCELRLVCDHGFGAVRTPISLQSGFTNNIGICRRRFVLLCMVDLGAVYQPNVPFVDMPIDLLASPDSKMLKQFQERGADTLYFPDSDDEEGISVFTVLDPRACTVPCYLLEFC